MVCGNPEAMPTIIKEKILFPFPITTNRIRLTEVAGSAQIAIKLDILGTSSINLYRGDPTFTKARFTKGRCCCLISLNKTWV